MQFIKRNPNTSYRCKICLSPKIELKGWFDPNTGKHTVKYHISDECWCNNCELFTSYVDVDLDLKANLNLTHNRTDVELYFFWNKDGNYFILTTFDK